MKVLDTSNLASTKRSVSEILGLSARTLAARLREIGPIDEADCPSAWEGLQLANARRFDFAYTYWHHATRVPASTDFSDGILTLGRSLPRIWSLLRSCVQADHSDRVWRKFKQDVEAGRLGDSSEMYRSKAGQLRSYAGPYAFLFGDHARGIRARGTHDYLRAPEIIEDIYRCYKARFSSDKLQKRFERNSRPCVVTFRSKGRPEDLEHALEYVHHALTSDDPAIFSVPGTSGSGRSIPVERIVRVRWVRHRPDPPFDPNGPMPVPANVTNGELKMLFAHQFDGLGVRS